MRDSLDLGSSKPSSVLDVLIRTENHRNSPQRCVRVFQVLLFRMTPRSDQFLTLTFAYVESADGDNRRHYR